MNSYPIVQLSLAVAAFAWSSTLAATVDIYVLRIGDDQPGQTANQHKPYSIVRHIWDPANPGTASLADTWWAPSTDPETRITMGNRFGAHSALSLSADGNYLVFAGRDVAVNGLIAEMQNQVLASFSVGTRAFDVTTRIPVTAVSSRMTSVTALDGTGFWVVAPNEGVGYSARGSAMLSTTLLTNFDTYYDVRAVGNRLWFTRSAGTNRGLYFMDYDGFPTSKDGSPDDAGWPSVNLADAGGTGWNKTGGGYSDFEFLDADTVFVGNSNNLEVFVRADPATTTFNLLEGADQKIGGWFYNTHLSLVELDDNLVQVFITQGTNRFDNVAGNNSALWTITWQRSSRSFIGQPIMLASGGFNYSFGGVVALVSGGAPAIESFWLDLPAYIDFKQTDAAGWINDAAFPWIYSASLSSWLHVVVDGGSAAAVDAWSDSGQAWLRMDAAYQGWYWNYNAAAWRRY
jgi:hypothetical protein